MAMATFAAGCFWGVEKTFRQLPGVMNTTVGYTGGNMANPTYEQVCSDKTGHAEAVQVEYDPEKISYEALLETFWKCPDPTTKNREGLDRGLQYRSVIFFHDEAQEKSAICSKEKMQASGRYQNAIVTEIMPVSIFY